MPILGPIYEHLISGHDILTYLAFLLVPLTYWALYSTRFGLRLRAVGENPAAVDTAGISVRGLRYSAVIICGVLVGLAGVYLVLSQAGLFPAAHERRARASSRSPRSSSPNGARGRRLRPASCSAFSMRWRSACRGSNCR